MNKNGQLKHLEMIQSIINRLAGNSFLIKGWTITISLAGFGLFVNNDYEPIFLLFVTFAAFLFWILDAYYLRQERLFRELYEQVVQTENSKKKIIYKLLSMDTTEQRKKVSSLLGVMFSFPTIIIYALIFAMTIILYRFFN